MCKCNQDLKRSYITGRFMKREPNALGVARYDPLIDIAYEQLKMRDCPPELRAQASRRIEQAGGIQHVEAMRSALQL